MSYALPLKKQDFGTSPLGTVLLGYIAAHASTRGCVRTQVLKIGMRCPNRVNRVDLTVRR